MIGGIGGYSANAAAYARTIAGQIRNANETYAGVNGTSENGDKTAGAVKNPGESDKVAAGRKSSPADCETCKERKYQDGSDEMVSFKSAAHISPNAAGAAVRAHEQEHVSNAYKKAAQNNGEVVRASVSIHTAICPECGRTYVSGGTTSTQIKYNNESNPYQQGRKSEDAIRFKGANVDLVG